MGIPIGRYQRDLSAVARSAVASRSLVAARPMMSSYLTALVARVLAMASNMVCGIIALKLYGHLSPAAYGVVGVALTIMGYLPLLDGGFRTTVNRAVLAEPK